MSSSAVKLLQVSMPGPLRSALGRVQSPRKQGLIGPEFIHAGWLLTVDIESREIGPAEPVESYVAMSECADLAVHDAVPRLIEDRHHLGYLAARPNLLEGAFVSRRGRRLGDVGRDAL